MKNVSSLLKTTENYQRNLLSENRQVVSKWERTGLLEGIDSEYEKNGIAVLLENQAKELIKEASDTGTSANSEEWSGVALPLVRRIFAEISAKDFVSVQPMSLPSGLIFYLDFKYGTAQAGFETGAGKDSQTDSVYGITDTTSDASQGLYGAGRFGYTLNDVTSSTLTRAAATSTTEFTTGSITADDYNYNTEFSSSKSSVFGTDVHLVTVSTASLSNADLNGARGFDLSGSGVVGIFTEFTKVTGAGNGTAIQFLVSGSDPLNAVVEYRKEPTDITRGDFEDGKTQEGTPDIPELNIEMKSIPIVAETRKLKAVWTPEFAQDLNAYHALDAEAELTNMLSEYISQEVDLEILDMLHKGARTTGYWSAKFGYQWNGSNGFEEMSSTQGAAAAYTQQNWFQTLGTVIQGVSNTIHQKTMRGGANFMVVSPKIATILESIEGYTADNTGASNPFAFGVRKVGQFNGAINVYKNPYYFQNTILMGYRGNQFLETGAVYAPYVPLVMTPLIYDPSSFTPRKGVMTRYAKKLVRPEFYGKVHVHGLETLGF